MNKAELINVVSEAAEVSKKDAETVITATLDAITDALKGGERARRGGFGSLEGKRGAPGGGRTPKPRDPIEIPASTVPVFKAGKVLKDTVGG